MRLSLAHSTSTDIQRWLQALCCVTSDPNNITARTYVRRAGGLGGTTHNVQVVASVAGMRVRAACACWNETKRNATGGIRSAGSNREAVGRTGHGGVVQGGEGGGHATTMRLHRKGGGRSRRRSDHVVRGAPMQLASLKASRINQPPIDQSCMFCSSGLDIYSNREE